MNRFLDLADEIASELCYRVEQREPAAPEALERLPLALVELYAERDGLELPFITFEPVAAMQRDFLPGWTCFGAAPPFSYLLFNQHDGSITVWDHELGVAPERTVQTLADLVEDAYREAYRESDSACAIHITDIPQGTPRARVVAVLKSICTLGSGEIARRLANLPTRLSATRASGVSTVRALRALGVDAHLAEEDGQDR